MRRTVNKLSVRHALLGAFILFGSSAAAPAAEIEHIIDYRFGVGFTRDSSVPGSGRSFPMYEGSYTARITHETDGGLTFRFDLGVAIGNFERPDQGAFPQDRWDETMRRHRR